MEFFVLICMVFLSHVVATYLPIPVRFSENGKHLIIQARIDGSDPEELILHYLPLIWSGSMAGVGAEDRIVRLSEDLLLGPTTVCHMPGSIGIFGIHPLSAYATKVKYNLLVPRSDDQVIMYPGVADPSDMCGPFTYSHPDMYFVPGMYSLHSNPITEELVRDDIKEQPDLERVYLDFSEVYPSIPTKIYRSMIRQMIALDGTTRPDGYFKGEFECLNYIDLLPSIEFISASDPTMQMRLVYEPRDYIMVNEVTGFCHIVVREGHASFGVSFFKRFAVHFDYENQRLGICDTQSRIEFLW